MVGNEQSAETGIMARRFERSFVQADDGATPLMQDWMKE